MANKALLLSFSQPLKTPAIQVTEFPTNGVHLYSPSSIFSLPQTPKRDPPSTWLESRHDESQEPKENVQWGGRFAATTGPSKPQRSPPGVDTRIHWDNEDEGWIGESSNSRQTKEKLNPEEEQKSLLGEKFADLLNDSSDSHYQFLGVSAEADLEEIKAAYRRLSKEYHPDTTSLPLKAASEKFMKLREVYNVLSDGESRSFYDWTLAQEAASRKAEKLRMRLDDPYQQDVRNYVPKPDKVDRLGGRNMELNDQALSALTFDAFVIIFAICCIVYVLVFKEPYY